MEMAANTLLVGSSKQTKRQAFRQLGKAYGRSRLSNGSKVLTGIDGRSLVARRYRDLIDLVVSDQGGLDRMSEARMQLARRFAALSVQAEMLEARLANGEIIDLTEYSQLTSTLVRVVSRLGIDRRARDVTPSLRTYLDHGDHEEPA